MLDLDALRREVGEGAEVLTVDDQQSQLFVWVQFDPEAEPMTLRLQVTQTGETVPPGIDDYLGRGDVSGVSWHVWGER